jgi:hypothetical protein
VEPEHVCDLAQRVAVFAVGACDRPVAVFAEELFEGEGDRFALGARDLGGSVRFASAAADVAVVGEVDLAGDWEPPVEVLVEPGADEGAVAALPEPPVGRKLAEQLLDVEPRRRRLEPGACPVAAPRVGVVASGSPRALGVEDGVAARLDLVASAVARLGK